MLPSINHLKRIYEKKQVKVQRKVSRPKLPSGFHYIGNRIITRYIGRDLKHFGVFSGDVVEIEKVQSFLLTRKDALYAVELHTGETKICAVSYRGLETVLHDGLGNHFSKHRTALLNLIGEVIGGVK